MHFTDRKTLQQDEVAERMNRTLLEKFRCLLSNAGLAKSFWAEALTYASHLINRLPSFAIGGNALMDVWSRKAAQDYDILRIFGCSAYYHVKEDKWDPQAKKVISVKGYKLWDLKKKKIVVNRDVMFDEAFMMKTTTLSRWRVDIPQRYHSGWRLMLLHIL